MSEVAIEVETRQEKGSNASRRLRNEGKVPAVVYGSNLDSAAITVNRRRVIELLQEAGGENAIFLLTLGKEKRHAMIREMQVDPITNRIEHIDFQRIDMSEKVTVEIQVELVGTPVGVKQDGGLVDFITRTVSVECLPTDIPTELELDISALHIGQHLEAKDLTMPDKVQLVEDEDKVIVAVAAPRLAEEDEEAEGDEGEALLEKEEEEPDVVGRGKSEE